jgi:hypothetical protein
MSIRIAFVFLGLFNLANGLYMLAAPEAWYAAVPGVAASGPMNTHFIADIGLAFVASGVGQLLAMRTSQAGAAFALAGSVWPALHAGLHVWGWFLHGLPMQSSVLLSEVVGVVGTSALGMLLAVRIFVREKQERDQGHTSRTAQEV